jgi:hypothetical protein
VTPTPTPSSASCSEVKAYDSGWNLLSASELSSLKAGNNIELCVSGIASAGTFDMGKFTINGVVQTTTTTQRPGSSDFCQAYVIPTGVYTFNTTAQIHNTIVGWVGP